MSTNVSSDLIRTVAGKIYRNLVAADHRDIGFALQQAVEAGIILAATPRSAGLTRGQRDLLNYIGDYIAQHDIPPSFDEMKDAMGLRSKSGIHRLITGLEERGAIRRIRDRARAIEVVDEPKRRARRKAA